MNYVGIDVAAKTLAVCVRRDDKILSEWSEDNNSKGHSSLLLRLAQLGPAFVVGLEWTGSYSLDVATALAGASGGTVKMINPRAAKAFHNASRRRAKTDRVDAASLAEFVQRMEASSWSPPDPVIMEVRSLVRRMADLTQMKTAETNRLHAVGAAAATTDAVKDDIRGVIEYLKKRIDALLEAALKLVSSHAEYATTFENLKTIKGIGNRTALLLISELLVLPRDMTGAQVAAFAGLDPRTRESGTSVRGTGSITKRGNTRVRAALYLSAVTAGRYDDAIGEFRKRLVDRGKCAKLAAVAVARRLLVTCWAMIKNGEKFDPSKFRPRVALAN